MDTSSCGVWYVSNVSIIFYCSMLLYYHSWMFYNHFIATLYHFLGLTYRHSAQCQLLFSACFLHRRKSIPNGVQTRRNFLWIFFGPEDIQWAKEVPKRDPECPPRWPPAPPLCSINTPIFQKP